jgi:hypothetical protein
MSKFNSQVNNHRFEEVTMILTNFIKGPIIPRAVTGLKWSGSATFTEIHEMTGREITWVHSPPQQLWIGFKLDGSGFDNDLSELPIAVENNTYIQEIEVLDLHVQQLQGALIKSLIAQTVGVENLNFDIYITDNLFVNQQQSLALKFLTIVENNDRYFLLNVDVKDRTRKLEDEGLLNTNERFSLIKEILELYWPDGIKFTFGGQDFVFSSDLYLIEDDN